MTVSTPPRPTSFREPAPALGPGEPGLDDAAVVEALREQALIEEARQRARRRRRRYAALVLLGVVVAVAGAVGFGRASGGSHLGVGAAVSRLAQSAAAVANGKIALAGYGGSLQVINPDGSGLRVVARCRATGTETECGILEPAWSPDGKRLAFVRGQLGGAVTPSRLVLYVKDERGGVRSLASCGSCGEQWGGHLSWSPDGSRIAFSRDSGARGQQSIWVVNTVTRKLDRLTNCLPVSCVDVDPAWSPNGQSIVLSRIADGSSSLYTVRSNDSQPTKITTVASAADPQWSPDGRQIAFDGNNRIYVTDADGSHLKLLLRGTRGSGPGVPSWSPDGTKLAYFNTPGRPSAFTAEVWTMNPDGSAARRLYHSPCCVGSWAAPIWSPDGKKIAFAADSGHGTFVINSNGSHLQRLAPASEALAWQPIP
jgi:Tol biopolymer transport system component